MKAEVLKMDDLEFRRAIYAAPFTKDENVVQAAQHDSSKQQFWDELKSLEHNLSSAVKIDVPNDLAHKLILRQSLNAHQQHKKRSRVYLALAASVAFAVGLSIKVFDQRSNYISISQDALAHVYETQGSEGLTNANISLNEVNASLAGFGSEFTAEIGRIYSSNFCFLNKLKALHLVLAGEQGNVSVFVLPHDKNFDLKEVFSDENFIGSANRFGKTDMIVVGEKGEDVEAIKSKLSKNYNQAI